MKFGSISRSGLLNSSLDAPSLVSLLVSLFPLNLLWPLTHWNMVGVILKLSAAAATWKSSLSTIPMKPLLPTVVGLW